MVHEPTVARTNQDRGLHGKAHSNRQGHLWARLPVLRRRVHSRLCKKRVKADPTNKIELRQELGSPRAPNEYTSNQCKFMFAVDVRLASRTMQATPAPTHQS
jgi:hypothetical protein